MTEIMFYVDRLEKFQGFEISGHTCFAAHGEDVVCAGISILAQSAVIGLEHFLVCRPQVIMKDGYLKCMLPAEISEQELTTAQIILETVYLGLKATATSYGKYLRITRRRWS